MTDVNDERLTILLVEDMVGQRELLAALLELENINSFQAGNVEEGIDILGRESVDAVVSDIQLPGESGIDLLHKIRKTHENLPVIIITGYGSINSAIEALKLGAQDYLTKPLGDGSELIKSIRRTVRHNRLKTEHQKLLEQLRQKEEKERNRLGNELHDVLCQDLASIAMLTSLIKKNEEAGRPQNLEDINITHEIAIKALSFTQRLARGLFPSVLEDNGLDAALEQLTRDQSSILKIPCNFKHSGNCSNYDREKALHLYRIAQEAINNAARNGHATEINVSLSCKGKNGVLRIDDNGRGIPCKTGNHNGMGLHIMRYRADMIGGKLEIKPRDKEGTCVCCEW